MTQIFIKDPNETEDYTFDWGNEYLASGETISGIPVLTVPSGITKSSSASDSTTVTVWLSGGTHGQEYLVAAKITTTLGRISERSIKLICRNR